MSRTHRRSLSRSLSVLALLALTAGAVTACSDSDSTAKDSPSSSAGSSTSPGTARAGEAKLHLVDNDGHRLAFYVTQGKGPTIVLDAGGGEDSSQWHDLIPKIQEATGATVVTYDRAGMGKSDVVPGAWSVESAVSDLKAGLDELGVTENVTLVSHSQAGEVATYFAKENPKMLSGVVLVDASLPPLYTDEEITRLAAAAQPQVDAAKKDPDKPQNRQLISTAESYVPMHKAYHKVSWPNSVPATVIVSEKTPFDGSPEDVQRWKDAARTFAADGPNRTLVTAANSSHDIPKDRPDLILKEIETRVTTQR
ncbi:alpha/beta fold hydrolase [Streptomyces shenzhenensis]|uniref:Alpha/beta hydrolase n=1 Tax=Streptomyces shenzhenensis TaxID=943815 RepID=A0A3M0I8I4_9ACTN|nr:alpha/beta hydrolase [Streptomyces shenzhenensis]RMB82509.1 alpha/beta hydrolase [Streptomyces shenzhenensis]